MTIVELKLEIPIKPCSGIFGWTIENMEDRAVVSGLSGYPDITNITVTAKVKRWGQHGPTFDTYKATGIDASDYVKLRDSARGQFGSPAMSAMYQDKLCMMIRTGVAVYLESCKG